MHLKLSIKGTNMFYDMISENSWRLNLVTQRSVLFLFSYDYSTFKPYTCTCSTLQERLRTMLGMIAGAAMKEITVFLQLHLVGQLSEVKGYLSLVDI